MKIATFNVNDVNKRLANLIGWLRAEKPDVVALQELKAADREFPKTAIEKAGYGAVWRGQKTWNGVAILARGCEPIVTRRELPGDPDDTQARYIEAAVNGVIVTSLYAPNGNPQPGPKFDYKLAWMERLLAHAKELYAAGVPVVLAGDYNVVPTDRDIYAVRSYADDALLQPAPRAQFQKLLRQGWRDALRAVHPDAALYTYWSYLRNRWPRDAGLRPAYQSGRDFDDELVEQLELIPKFVAACGFANARRAGYEADDFLAAAAFTEERRGGTVLVASGDRDSFQLASEKPQFSTR
jgi:exodeoxyribonuclease III